MTTIVARLRLLLAGLVRSREALEDGDRDHLGPLLESLELDMAELVATLERRRAI